MTIEHNLLEDSNIIVQYDFCYQNKSLDEICFFGYKDFIPKSNLKNAVAIFKVKKHLPDGTTNKTLGK